MSGISRRSLLWPATLLATPGATAGRRRNEDVHRFSTPGWDVQMTVVFYDHYSSSGFWFRERRRGRDFCLSAEGRQGADCLPNFAGALAVVRYRIRPATGARRTAALRERVRTIDQDDRLKTRPPFEAAIEIRDGVASDIQAFGYETQGSTPAEEDHDVGPWCLVRQDLYLDTGSAPFLVLHWKHTLHEIRILDMIPGEGTR